MTKSRFTFSTYKALREIYFAGEFVGKDSVLLIQDAPQAGTYKVYRQERHLGSLFSNREYKTFIQYFEPVSTAAKQ